MPRAHELAEFGSIFEQQLTDAIAAQEPHVAERLRGELRAGNYEIDVSETKVVTVRIGGAIVLEAQLYPKTDAEKLN